MAPTHTSTLRPDELHARSYTNLENARAEAHEERGYSSEEALAIMSDSFQACSSGQVPFDWQAELAESFCLGLDYIGQASTGSGKTIPIVLPLFLPENREKTVVVISPLISLERDQVSTKLRAT